MTRASKIHVTLLPTHVFGNEADWEGITPMEKVEAVEGGGYSGSFGDICLCATTRCCVTGRELILAGIEGGG